MINLDRVHGVTPSMTAEKAMAAVKAWPPARRSAVGSSSRARRREQAVRRGRKEGREKDIGPGGASAGDYVDCAPGASVLDLTAGREARAGARLLPASAAIRSSIALNKGDIYPNIYQ